MPKGLLRGILATVCCLAATPDASAELRLGRVFLHDGTTLTCYGEYARVNERIVFSLPLGTDPNGQPRLQLVTLPSSRVDWGRTDRYRDAVRAVQYAETRGEADFTRMTGEVAQTLNDIAFAGDAARKLALAEEARRRLTDWPAAHFGYRAAEVRDIVALLDEAVTELRASTGARSFDLNLVATAIPDQPTLLPDPQPPDVIAQAIAIADLSDVPAERGDLLRAVLSYIDAPGSGVSDVSRAAVRAFAGRMLEQERRDDEAYAALTARAAADAASRASRADVGGLERLVASVNRQDQALGRRRPDQVRALLAALGDHLAAARRLRLARDRWALRVSVYRSYTRLIRTPLKSLDAMHRGLEDIKRLAGPDTTTLGRLARLADRASRELHLVVPPADLAAVHSLLQSAVQMGHSAARIRLEAVTLGNMTTAWNASAAAAGSLMLVAQARDELARYMAPPTIR